MYIAKTPVDWERIEAQYRAGGMSLREICFAHGDAITEGAIRKRAKRDGWVRGVVSELVRQRAEELTRKQLVQQELAEQHRKVKGLFEPAPTETTDTETIEVEARVQARIAIAHRGLITRLRVLALRLIEECEAESGDVQALRELGELMAKPDDRGVDKLNEAYHKAISLPTRIKGVKELADTLKSLVALEREAYGLDKVPLTPPEADHIDPTDAARRLAFLLSQAAHAQPAPSVTH